MQKIAIIGSSSFLAKYLIDKLRIDNELYLYGRTPPIKMLNGITFNQFDYPRTVFDLKDLLRFDVVIYTAAGGVQAATESTNISTYQINAFLPIEIADLLSSEGYKGKFFTFGSYFEIGNNSNIKSYTEDEVVLSSGNVPNAYCDSKRLLSRFYSNRRFSINWTHLIIPSLYGPGENENRLIPYVINGLRSNFPLKLSSGVQTRQYIYVSDLVELIHLLIVSDAPSDIYNVVGPDVPIKIKELVCMIFENMGVGYQNNETINTRDEGMLYLSLDDSKIRAVLPKWGPMIKLKEGIMQYL